MSVPWRNIAALLHEGSQGKPQRVGYTEVVGDIMLSREVPFVGTKATDEEENDTDPDVGEDDAHPDLVGQRIHEAEHMGFVVHGLLDHDGDAQRHEGLGEVDHLLPVGSDSQRGDGHVSFLTDRRTCASWLRS